MLSSVFVYTKYNNIVRIFKKEERCIERKETYKYIKTINVPMKQQQMCIVLLEPKYTRAV